MEMNFNIYHLSERVCKLVFVYDVAYFRVIKILCNCKHREGFTM